MAYSSRSALADVEVLGRSDDKSDLFKVVSGYSFHQLVELLTHLSGVDPEMTLRLPPHKEPVRFKSHAGLGFPKSDVISATRTKNGGFNLEVSFMGLHGSQSPMPSYYLDTLAWEDAQNEEGLKDFLDVFNHRIMLILHHSWRKYRYHVCFENDGTDPFSQRVFALVGLGNDIIRQDLPVNRTKMLAYAGMLASPGRSPEVICSLVSHCFDLPDVELKPWKFRKVALEPEEQNRLGQVVTLGAKRFLEKTTMGVNFTLGAYVPDRSGKFMLQIKNLSREHFLSFLPNGENYIPLITFVSFILRDQFAWDLRLGLASQQVGGIVLGEETRSQLGWTTFLGQPEAEPHVTLCVRQ